MNDEAQNKENGNEKDQEKDNEKKDTSKFDWVTARSSCTLPKVFKELRLQVEGDVKTRNALRPNNSPYEFSVADEDTGAFKILLSAKAEGKEVHKSVVFNLAEHAILVRDDQGHQMFEVTLAFDDDGDCKLYVNEEQHEMWQVRRKALEELMFRGY